MEPEGASLQPYLVLSVHMLQVQGNLRNAGIGEGQASAQTLLGPKPELSFRPWFAGRADPKMGLGSMDSSAGSATNWLPNSSLPVVQVRTRITA